MNRGMGTPQKDDGVKAEQGRATKSGRKVKRPAHFDDSPDSKKVTSADEGKSPKVVSASETSKKSARKTILKSVDDTPSKNGGLKSESTRKTIHRSVDDTPDRKNENKPVPVSQRNQLREEPESVKKSSRKTFISDDRDESPEPEASKKTARRTLLKSAVKNSSVEQVGVTLKKKSEIQSPVTKKIGKSEPEEAISDVGVSRTGRKIKVPAHLKEFEDILVASPKKEVQEKNSSRKSVAQSSERNDPEVDDEDSKNDLEKGKIVASRKSVAPKKIDLNAEQKHIPKTPGRGRSLALPRKELTMEADDEIIPSRSVSRKSMFPSVRKNDSETEEKITPKTPGKATSRSDSQNESGVESEGFATKTPSRRAAKSTALAKTDETIDPSEVSPSAMKEVKLTSKTPSKKLVHSSVLGNASPNPAKAETNKRGKSLAPEESKSPNVDKPPTKTPSKRGKSLASVVRNSSPDLAPKTPKAAKIAEDSSEPISRSGRKIKPKKYFGEFEEMEDIFSIMPKVSSPVKPNIKRATEKKQSPQKKISPAKRATLSPQEPRKSDASPPKKTKLDPEPNKLPKVSKISPTTEERQITVRGTNDHHHHHILKDVDIVIEKDPLAVSSEETLAISPKTGKSKVDDTPTDVNKTDVPVEEINSQREEPKSKRGRKTLPAPAVVSEEYNSKAPKTPSSRRMTSAAPVQTDDAGSSRSGRKIKPKKFFGEEEVANAPAPTVHEGRGKRKTQALEMNENIVDGPRKGAQSTEKLEAFISLGNISSTTELAEIPSEVQKPQDEQLIALTNLLAEEEYAVTADVEPTSVNGNHFDTGAMAAESSQGTDDLKDQRQHVDVQIQGVDEQPDPLEYDLQQLENDDTTPVENFQGTRIEQTSPAQHQTEKAPPNDPALLAEKSNQTDEIVESFSNSGENDPTDIGMIDSVCPDKLLVSSETHQEDNVVSEDVLSKDETQVQEEQRVLETTSDAISSDDQENPQIAEPAVVTVETPSEALDANVETTSEEAANEEPASEEPASEEPAINNSKQEDEHNPEISTNSNFSESLIVEEDTLGQLISNESKETHFEGIAFLEESAARTLPTETAPGGEQESSPPDEPLPEDDREKAIENIEHQDQINEQNETPLFESNQEDDLDSTKPPEMVDFGFDEVQEHLEDVPEPSNGSFVENDRDDESIIVLPDTPFVPKSDTSAPATPKTPESKTNKNDNFSPDKPDDQQQAGFPQIIEIFDSPTPESAVGSVTSTPLDVPAKLTIREQLIQSSRKRSLSASDAEICKKNVTFHSPANSTILVDTIDERLKKSVKNDSSTKSGFNPRKRSLSEQRELGEGIKPAKVTKLPNFKNIHQQHFKRMESIEEFHNRKVQRAKLLVNAGSKSPAAASITKFDPHKSGSGTSSTSLHKSPYKTGNGTASHTQFSSSGSKSHIAKPTASGGKPLSDADRLERRQKQFQAAFKPKVVYSSGGSDTPGKDTSDGTRRVVEQSRHKQSQILKGVRTNKRFELMMKFRDGQE
ncbi:serine/arginine repetitive matrix protein 2 [Malaya genurostris]|uniref:serine/arginine repetitive matrix protein 2 n=1 Tax=Malaya genurostris TaxID=325434 RepID=UPI0026F395B6|nr:serine/arginine repetitive matrix protein 2 [Malaya genurostris]